MLDSMKFYHKRIKEGVLKDMWRETVWIYEYARKYWKQMIFYTLLGLSGTVISLISSLISRDMVDIITGKQAGLLVRTFCLATTMTASACCAKICASPIIPDGGVSIMT